MIMRQKLGIVLMLVSVLPAGVTINTASAVHVKAPSDGAIKITSVNPDTRTIHVSQDANVIDNEPASEFNITLSPTASIHLREAGVTAEQLKVGDHVSFLPPKQFTVSSKGITDHSYDLYAKGLVVTSTKPLKLKVGDTMAEAEGDNIMEIPIIMGTDSKARMVGNLILTKPHSNQVTAPNDTLSVTLSFTKPAGLEFYRDSTIKLSDLAPGQIISSEIKKPVNG